jgi:hypothetical protein
VILDEVQTLPHRYWELSGRPYRDWQKTTDLFHPDDGDPPHIFKAGRRSENLRRAETYFHALDRLDLHVHREPVGIAESSRSSGRISIRTRTGTFSS